MPALSLLLCFPASATCAGSSHQIFTRDPTTFNWTSLTPLTTLNWESCYDTFQCARLAVPMLYSSPSSDQAAVALIRLPSNLSTTDVNYKGPILFNPGGPGGSGVQFILETGTSFQTMLGPEFDIVGFDPRGVGFTTPPISVFKDSIEAGAFFIQRELDINATESSLGRSFAQQTLLGKLVEERALDVAKTVSTPTVAHDMLSITRAAGHDKLQYWGFSYGTVLGATFAAMFPDNVGRLIIDGVVDAEAYYMGNWTGFILDMDKVYTNILDACVEAGPSLCPIFENTTAQVHTRVENLMDKLRIEPVLLFNSTAINSAIVDYYATVRDQMLATLYFPYDSGANLTQALAALEQGNASPIYHGSSESMFHAFLEGQCPAQTGEPFVAGVFDVTSTILCGDIVTDDVQTISDARAAYDIASKLSPEFAGVWLGEALCSGWTVRADDRFNGSFIQNTSFPLLVIGNVAGKCFVTGSCSSSTYELDLIKSLEPDPVTPLASAVKMSKGFANSVLLTRNASGHTSLSGVSNCTSQAVRTYFADGTLPKEGTVCEVESAIFNSPSGSMGGITSVLQRIKHRGIGRGLF
ncbi:alpha/beta-hydrolase [Fomitiporia mediterranea MF3/22]|uniref:alpha/beta-hydrolase n=1 Tax=Fomitiporia mediterranea (strain MF3/22) TaxID=694068 RepID=UPI00044085D1|nr:alpha/beta-hydrolase [Fomitiporia mediterranea MF3/22]EJC98517.1 alpha/beta-hydrolase [Fomitiporia mediterranea MF3/22]